MKLQNAYVTEANAVGNYTMIGYEMASTTNFAYDEPATPKAWSTGTSAIPATGSSIVMWTAKNNVALNECDSGKYWVLSVQASSGSGVDYIGGIGSATATTYTDNDCLALTSSFKSIADNN